VLVKEFSCASASSASRAARCSASRAGFSVSRDALQGAQGAAQGRLGAAVDLAQRGVDAFHQLFPVHEAVALVGQLGLLAGARVEGVELLHRVAQEGLVALGLGKAPGGGLARRQGVLPGTPELAQIARLGRQAAVGVQQRAVGRRVHQAALVELALDLDQRVRQLAQQAGRGGLVVHVGTAAAVRGQHAAQQQQVFRFNALLGEQGAGGMIGGDVKGGGDAGLLGVGPEQTRVGTVAKREAQRIKQDRLAGAGFPGQHTESAIEGKVELLDNDDVADRQADQHSPILCRG